MCCAVTTYSIGKSVQTMVLIRRVLLEKQSSRASTVSSHLSLRASVSSYVFS